MHAAAVGFDNVFHHAQANADALRFAAQFGAQPVKTLENFLLLGQGDAGAVVGHRET